MELDKKDRNLKLRRVNTLNTHNHKQGHVFLQRVLNDMDWLRKNHYCQ